MSSNSPEIGVFIDVGAVFPELQADEATFIRLLNGLSLTDTLFWCARLNQIVSGLGDKDPKIRQQRALDALGRPSDVIARINDVARQQGGADFVRVFFRGQLLELARWTARHSVDLAGDGATFDDPAVRRRFIQAALIASEFWGRRTFNRDTFNLAGGVSAARRRTLGAVRKGIEEAAGAPDLERSLGRGWTLFTEYFPNRYPGFNEEFRAAVGLTPEEYYICIVGMITSFMSPTAKTPIFDWTQAAQATPYSDVFPRYVRLESQTADELVASLWFAGGHTDYRSLRERPILRTPDNRAIILDPVFYSERASVGPLFHLLRPGVTGQKANTIFGAFGNAVEDYAADILKRMYPAGSDALARRLECNVRGTTPTGQEIEIDAVLNDVTELLIFETKASWLREDRITGDYADYIEHIRAKYGVGTTPGAGERVKGVGQLARIVEAISTGWTGPKGEFASARKIHPVLLVHDSLLGVGSYGNFLASEFAGLLNVGETVQEIQRGGIRIAPLTIMTIGDLENFECSVGEFSLQQILEDYSRQCPDRVQSLHNFIALSSYRNRMFRNRTLAASTSDVMRRTKDALFPDAPSLDEERPRE